MTNDPGEITILLRAWQAGDAAALEQLTPLVYGELQRLARRSMGRERREHTLQPTALVHEAYLRLTRQREVDWQERRQFYALAAQQMRRILLDHARARQAGKRNSGLAPLELPPDFAAPARDLDLLALDDALQRLAQLDPDKAHIVNLRFFAGLSVEQVAETLGSSSRSVARQWALARAWLYGELRPGAGGRRE